MKTFLYIHKYSSAVLTISASNEDEAQEVLTDIVKETYGWRLEETSDEEDDDSGYVYQII